MRQPLAFYLAQPYAYIVEPDPAAGGFVISFPELPGCLTQVEEAAEIAPMAAEIRELWLESAWQQDLDIPLPAPIEYSGKFVVRLPRSLHRSLVASAERDGISLNAYISTMLARGDAQHAVECRLEAIEAAVDRLDQERQAATKGAAA